MEMNDELASLLRRFDDKQADDLKMDNQGTWTYKHTCENATIKPFTDKRKQWVCEGSH